MTFDATDPKHQVGPEWKPDKADTWSIPAEEDQWVLVHNAFRAEAEGMKKALAAVVERTKEAATSSSSSAGGDEKEAAGTKISEWEVESIKTWWEMHSAIRTDHCKNGEDGWLKPMFVERFRYPEGLEDEHKSVGDASDKVATLIAKLSTSTGDADGETSAKSLSDLVSAWSAYEAALLPHLRDEEQTIFALRRVYFTQEEMVAEDREIIYEAPEEAMGALIYHMGEEKFRSKFMKARGIPFFVWHAAFKGRLSTYKKNMVSHLDALVEGRPPDKPMKKKKGFFGLY